MTEEEKKKRLDRIALSDAAIRELNDPERLRQRIADNQEINALLEEIDELDPALLPNHVEFNVRALWFALGFGVAMSLAVLITLLSGK